LSYTRVVIFMVDRKRIELFPKACKAPVLPLSLTAHKNLVVRTGFEPIQRESKSLVLPLHHRTMAEKVRVELTEAMPRQFSKLL
jgi:hypothetical protein